MRRRNATTEFLKECMADALLRLLKEKSLEDITITEITDLADVGRVTFYRNFTKKEELIIFKLKLLGEQFAKEHPCKEKPDRHYLTQQFFLFIYSIRDVLTTLYNANLIETILIPLYENTRQKNLDDTAKLFQSSFFAFGIIGIIVEWTRNEFQESPEQVLEIMEKIEKRNRENL